MDRKFMQLIPSKRTDKLFFIVGILSILYALISKIYLLGRGLIFTDEGWYLTLMRDNPDFAHATRYYKLFQFGITDNIYANRIISLSLILIAAILYSYSIFVYQKNKGGKYSFLFCVGCVFIGLVDITQVTVLNYRNLNIFFGTTAVSCLILWIATKKNIFIALSSFFCSFILETQPTSIILLPLLFCVSLFFSKRKMLTILSFFSGIIIFAIYFAIVDNPRAIMSYINNLANNTVNSGSNVYGLFFIIKWFVNAISFITKYLLLALLVFGAKYFLDKEKTIRWNKNLIIIVLFLCSFIYVDFFILPKNVIRFYPVADSGFCWFLYFYCILINFKKISFKEDLLLLLIAVTPICLTIGTNMPFPNRQWSYVMLFIPLVIIAPSKSYLLKYSIVLYCLLTFVVAVLSFNNTNWKGEKPLEQTVELKSIGINQPIKLSRKQINSILRCKQIIGNNPTCICGPEGWGYVELLNFKPESYQFCFVDQNELIDMIERILVNKKEVYYLTDSDYIIDEIHLEQLKEISIKQYKVDELLIFRIKKID